MLGEIPAVYENGCLRLLHPPDLCENEAVRVIILPGQPVDERDEVVQIMIKAGLMRHRRPRHPPPDPVPKEERIRLAEKLGRVPGRPLSEIIISERGQ